MNICTFQLYETNNNTSYWYDILLSNANNTIKSECLKQTNDHSYILDTAAA